MKATNISLKKIIEEAMFDRKKQQLLESLAKPEPAFQMLEEQYGIPNVPLTEEEKKKMLEEIRRKYKGKPARKQTLQEFLKDVDELFL